MEEMLGGVLGMDINNIDEYTPESVTTIMSEMVDQVIIVDSNTNRYRRIISRGFMDEFLPPNGYYDKLLETLYFHMKDSGDTVVDGYKIFLSSYGTYDDKYTRRCKMVHNDEPHIVQMTIYPVKGTGMYIFVLNELDYEDSRSDMLASTKVNTIQNTYLFSMYIDLIKNTTSSISVSEVSDENMHSHILYTDWRLMIVNMIWPQDKEKFLRRTDPEYLKKHFAPGQYSSFDVKMQNLEGVYIWVKLIFSRSQTLNADDYRFVFMVQDINESMTNMNTYLKEFEEKASIDALTGVFNHGRIETEITNAIENVKKTGEASSIMILDIDFFKEVNDNFGHSVGDKTLKVFSKVVGDYLKERGSVLGRWGGEEFVAVCYNSSIDKTRELSESLLDRIGSQHFEKVGNITASIGTTALKLGDDLTSAFERMDKALYQAKSDGRNCVRVID
jgi:diguanylate cyclase (GGDEF)-like protein